MAVTQYIGARYVPKFYEGSSGSAWDANIVYEPLTIVTWLGSSWTSKKAVPATVGAPNLNPNYWVNTGNFNQQAQQMLQAMAEILENIGTLESAIETASDQIGNIQEDQSCYPATDVKANFLGLYDSFITQIGALACYDGRLYTVDGVSAISGTTSRVNTGCIREWNMSDGSIRSTNNVTTGHANSCCYNPENAILYIAPTWDYSQEDRPDANYLYKVNPSNYSVAKVNTGSVNALGLAYDYADGTMYMLGYDYVLYKWDISNDTYTEYLDLSSIGINRITGALMQDIAVYDKTLYWTTARNQLGVIKLYETPKLFRFFNIDTYDSNNMFDMGEMEGINFDEDGHLLASFFANTGTTVSKHSIGGGYSYRNVTNFICEIPTDIAAPYNKFYLPANIVNQTFTISGNGNSFKLPNGYTLQTMFQFNALVNKPRRISLGADISAQYGCPRLVLLDDLVINLNGHTISYWNGFQANGGCLTIEGTGTISMMDDYDEVFYVGRGGLITAGGANLTLQGLTEKNNNYINAGSLSQLIIDNATVSGNVTPMVYNMERERYAVYSGARKIIDPE